MPRRTNNTPPSQNTVGTASGLIASNISSVSSTDAPVTFDGIYKILEYKIAKATVQVLLYIIIGAIGAIFAIAWDLNGKIYEAVGQRKSEKEIQRLEDKIEKLNRKLSLYESKITKETNGN